MNYLEIISERLFSGYFHLEKSEWHFAMRYLEFQRKKKKK